VLRPEDIIEERKKWDEYAHHGEEKIRQEYSFEDEFGMNIRTKLIKGEIIDETVRNWLDTEITTARTVLIAGMVLTALIRGQVFIWAIMYIAYRGRVKQAREKAWNRNIKDYGRYLE
jgi:hypothetical protein